MSVDIAARSLAEQIGLKTGNYILEINGIKFLDTDTFRHIVSNSIINVMKV